MSESVATVRPTRKQRELLGFIEAFIAEHGYSPSYREIMHGLSYNSVATVSVHVGNLIRRGHLRKRDRSARSIELAAPDESAPVRTNHVAPAEDKWLVGKVEHLIVQSEADGMPEAQRLDDISVLLQALRVLGMDGAAQSFTARLQALRLRIPEGMPE